MAANSPSAHLREDPSPIKDPVPRDSNTSTRILPASAGVPTDPPAPPGTLPPRHPSLPPKPVGPFQPAGPERRQSSMDVGLPPSPYCQIPAVESHPSTTTVRTPDNSGSKEPCGSAEGQSHSAQGDDHSTSAIQRHVDAGLEARRAEAHVSTAHDFQLNLFCDASMSHDRHAGAVGSYAYTFKKYRPGTNEHGEWVAVAWPVDVVVGPDESESVAIVDTVHAAKHELEHIMGSRQISPSNKP
ncbi:hypothetical protein QBC40DRAFT_319488 [Triangularia verruculosa]|uniref:Uncharacterized protein n=1 Tax=Triangularia verruculosa TaxID=2587418 RepID=A0AAN7APL2_9PEZI|nr:hypothetical protein QBC40DRAFT_319488 [Triangularia verruculosa]